MSSTIPAKPVDVDGDGSWLSQHTRFVCQSKEKEADVLLLGDSVLLNYQFSTSYRKFMEPLHCLNFCIYSDQTQHILWRIENGELDGFTPKVIVLMVGSHNSGHTAEEVVDGIVAIVEKAKHKQPNAALIVMGLLPVGRAPNPKRTKHDDINKQLQIRLHQRPGVTFLQPDWSIFIQPYGCPGAAVAGAGLADHHSATNNGSTSNTNSTNNANNTSATAAIKAGSPRATGHGGSLWMGSGDSCDVGDGSSEGQSVAGLISHRDMYDYMHPTARAYGRFAEPLIEELQNHLHTFIKTNAPSNSFCE